MSIPKPRLDVELLKQEVTQLRAAQERTEKLQINSVQIVRSSGRRYVNLFQQQLADFRGVLDERFAEYERKTDERFTAFEAKIDERCTAFEANIDERFEKELGPIRSEQMALRWLGIATLLVSASSASEGSLIGKLVAVLVGRFLS